jgi:hypothetical protein
MFLFISLEKFYSRTGGRGWRGAGGGAGPGRGEKNHQNSAPFVPNIRKNGAGEGGHYYEKEKKNRKNQPNFLRIMHSYLSCV